MFGSEYKLLIAQTVWQFSDLAWLEYNSVIRKDAVASRLYNWSKMTTTSVYFLYRVISVSSGYPGYQLPPSILSFMKQGAMPLAIWPFEGFRTTAGPPAG